MRGLLKFRFEMSYLKKDVFFCHASEDKPMIKSVSLGLERYGISSWIDELEIQAGDSILEKIQTGISNSAYFFIFLSENSQSKPWVQLELKQAISLETKYGKQFVFPVLMHDCKFPADIEERKYINLQNWDVYSVGIQNLANIITGGVRVIPNDFDLTNLNHNKIPDSVIAACPPDQAAIEFRLRYDRWSSRKISTIRNHSKLTLYQIINYCETASHIALAPKFNSIGEIFYGVKWRVMEDYIDDNAYYACVNRYLMLMKNERMQHRYEKELLDYLFEFYE